MIFILCAAGAPPAIAQRTAASTDSAVKRSTPPMPANDSLFRRARRLVSEGNGMVGRAIVDSLLRHSVEGTTSYGDAVYWHGALAETAADAERDYRRVIVEYPLSIYADDALLAIAELEQARGDRAGALQHLQRFVREHPVSSARGIAALAAGRLAFEQRDPRTACAMIAEARASASTTDVELRNQIDYYGSRCPASVAASTRVTNPSATSGDATSALTPAPAAIAPPAAVARPAAAVVAVPRVVTPKVATPPVVAPQAAGRAAAVHSSAARPIVSRTTLPAAKPAPEVRHDSSIARTGETSSRGEYTIQLAAFNTRTDADQLIRKLAGRGVDARVSGSAKPFRVRLNFYHTREAAATVVASLKARGIVGFVTTEAPAPEGRTP